MSDFAWATVTAAGGLASLRVQLDGDPSALPTPPHDCLVDPTTLGVGARVRCEWEQTRNGRRLVLHGRAGGTSALGAYPVGAIYMSINPAHPATLFGGQWAVWGTGRVAVGVDPADPDFATPEQVGGTKAVTLTVAQMPSHTHTQAAHSHTSAAHSHTMEHTHTINHGHGAATTTSAGAHTHGPPNDLSGNFLFQNLQVAGTQGQIVASGGNNLIRFQNTVSSAGAHTHNVTVPNFSGNSGGSSAANTGSTTPPATGSTTPEIDSTGGSQPHNNLQPYIACFMWVRTA